MASPHESGGVCLSYLIYQAECFCFYDLADNYRKPHSAWPFDLIIFAEQNLNGYENYKTWLGWRLQSVQAVKFPVIMNCARCQRWLWRWQLGLECRALPWSMFLPTSF